MALPKLTAFQRLAEERIREVATAADLTITERRAMTGQMPHMRQEETAVKILFDGVQVWLYEDEATFSHGQEDRRFERADYESQEDLLNALIAELRESLS